MGEAYTSRTERSRDAASSAAASASDAKSTSPEPLSADTHTDASPGERGGTGQETRVEAIQVAGEESRADGVPSVFALANRQKSGASAADRPKLLPKMVSVAPPADAAKWGDIDAATGGGRARN